MEEETVEMSNFPLNVSELANLIQEKITTYTYKFTFDDTDENVDQDFYLRFNCIQGWFIRCSFKTKVDFLKKCAFEISSLNSLITIINTLYTATSKDRIYSISLGYFPATDMKLMPDDNRCLHKETLENVMNNQMNWFKTLSNNKQYFFIIKLITLADGLVVMNNIFAHFIDVLVARSKKTIIKSKTISGITFSFPVVKDENLEEMIDYCFRNIFPLKVVENVSNSELNSLLLKWKQFIYRYTEQIYACRVEENESDNVSIKTSKKDEIIDIIQRHPLWITMLILKNLDNHNHISKVNEYWTTTVKEYKGELAARKMLDKEIAAMEDQIQKINFNKKVQMEFANLRNRISVITKPSFRNKFKTKQTAYNSLICEVYKDYLVDFNLFSKKLQSFPRAVNINKSKSCNI